MVFKNKTLNIIIAVFVIAYITYLILLFSVEIGTSTVTPTEAYAKNAMEVAKKSKIIMLKQKTLLKIYENETEKNDAIKAAKEYSLEQKTLFETLNAMKKPKKIEGLINKMQVSFEERINAGEMVIKFIETGEETMRSKISQSFMRSQAGMMGLFTEMEHFIK